MNFRGRPTLQVVWRLPKRMADEVWGFIDEHEKWMRETHQYQTEDADPMTPRMIEYYLTLGDEYLDPLHVSSPSSITAIVSFFILISLH
jgi:hypothetical protein